MPGDPVAAIVARFAQGLTNATGVQAIYEQYTELFGTNLPIIQQFFIYVRNVFNGDFGYSIEHNLLWQQSGQGHCERLRDESSFE